jgi:hypothetical protein
MSVFDRIRQACAEVASRARHVGIDETRVAEWAAALPATSGEAPGLDPAHHFTGDEAATVAFVLALDAVNFGSGYFPHLAKLPGLSGYFTVATRLTERYRAAGPLTSAELAAITPEGCTALFVQDPGNAVVAVLMNLFARAWNDLGRLLLERHGGDARALLAAANGKAERLVELLAEMPFYRDVASHDGTAVPLYKRAQLTAADLHLALGGAGLGHFEDLDELTIFADNLVPHVLRLDGVLRVDPDVVRRIDASELIPPGAAEEVELRACAVHAVEQIREAVARTGRVVTAMQLDYLLWNRGQLLQYKARPRHRTRTVYY